MPNGPQDGKSADERPPFDWTVIPCASREAAEVEAKLQQAVDSADAEWIYVEVDGVWVAKRTPTDLALYPPLPDAGPDPFWKRIAKLVVSILLTPNA
jgi:hypothetical protein